MSHNTLTSEQQGTTIGSPKMPLSWRTISLRMLRQRLLVGSIVVALAAVSLLVSAYAFHWFVSAPMCSVGSSGNVPSYVRYTVIISVTGYNDSRDHSRPWPIMNVTLGQGVTIYVWNNDSVQPHGFAIKHYFEQGVALQPGHSCYLHFSASQVGTFAVCNTILDTTDVFEYAEFNVNPQ